MNKKKFLDIHFEGMDDQGEKLEFLIDIEVPCAISIAPFTLREGWYSNRVLGLVDSIVRHNGILGQQGNYHKCRHAHTIADPYHENHCLWNSSLGINEQYELMAAGQETMLKYFGISPQLYVPPNHQYDDITLEVAEIMRYKFFGDRGITNRKPYHYPKKHGQMVVIPEVKLGSKGDFYYIHYDEITSRRNEFENLIRQLGSFSEIEPETPNPLSIRINYELILMRKLLRDVKKIFKK